MLLVQCKWCKCWFKKNRFFKKYCSYFCRKNGNNYYRKGQNKYKRSLYWSKMQKKNVNLRSSYELTYCEYLDSQNIQWLYEPKRFYMDDGKKYYLPDFYLPQTNEWKEVKGKWYKKSREKFERFKILYPTEKIDVVGTSEIMELRKMMRNYK